MLSPVSSSVRKLPAASPLRFLPRRTKTTRRIAEHAFRKGAVAAVLTHNHPGGISTPSAEDVAVTRRIEAALQLLEITLLDHFVLHGRGYPDLPQAHR